MHMHVSPNKSKISLQHYKTDWLEAKTFHEKELSQAISGSLWEDSYSDDDVTLGWSSESQLKQRFFDMEDCPNNPCC